jgi:hypothetical protein
MQPARNASSDTILARAFDLLSRRLSEVRFFVLPDFVDGSDHDRAAMQRKPKVSSRSQAPCPGVSGRKRTGLGSGAPTQRTRR